MSELPVSTAPSGWIVETADTRNVQIWGLSASERHRRLLERVGCESIRVIDPNFDAPKSPSDSVLILRSDTILDERLIKGLFAADSTVLMAPRRTGSNWGGPVAAHVPSSRAAEALQFLSRAPGEKAPAAPPDFRLAAPSEIASAYAANLRKFDPPFIFEARAEDTREIEDHLFTSSYKGVTDLITKWLWPRPAAAVVRVLARAGVCPNTVTIISWVLTLAALVLFWNGAFGLGLVCAWLMTFLDTVDGKLARVTLTSSKLGNVLDHGLDQIHPPFWYFAWGFGLTGGFGLDGSFGTTTAVVVIGYVIGRLLEGAFILLFQIETHCWRPIDSLFRTVTARRNPNMILLTVGTLAGRPDLGLVMVAIWTVVSLGFHSVRVLQAFADKSRGIPIERWDESFITSPPSNKVQPDSGTIA